MRKLYILGLVALAAGLIGYAIAEDITLTTYYPAPYGVYKVFTTTSKTTLATDPSGADPEAKVGIGTENPGQLLDVDGISKTDVMFLNPVNPNNYTGQDGMMLCDSTDGKKIKHWDSSVKQWVGFAGSYPQAKLFDEKTLCADEEFKRLEGRAGAGPNEIGLSLGCPLKIIKVTPQDGIYAVSWDGQVEVDASESRGGILSIRYANGIIEQLLFCDTNEGPSHLHMDRPNGRFTPHNFSGREILFLQGGVNYDIRAFAQCMSYSTVRVLKGFKLKIELILPL